jgi:tetratricopeptide (TPR) repeat protein
MSNLEQGIKLINKARYKQALPIIQKAVESDPNNPECSAYLAIILIRIKRYKEAERVIDALRNIPGSENYAATFIAQGTFLGEHKKLHQDAIRLIDNAISLDPSNPFSWVRRGLINEQQEKYQEALDDYNKALEIDSQYTLALNNRGNIKQNQGDFQGALKDYEKIIEIDPIHFNSRKNRGQLIMDKENYQGALEDFNIALEIDPDNAELWDNRGFVKEKLGENLGALEDHSKAIEVDPNYAFAWNNRGVAKEKQGKYQDALADYSKAIEIDPNFVLALTNRGYVKRTLGYEQEALDDFNHVLQNDKNNSTALWERVEINKKNGQYEITIADRKRYYALEGYPKLHYENSDDQKIHDAVREHFIGSLKNDFERKDEKLIEIWYCYLFWGEDQKSSLAKGIQSTNYYGYFGAGYLCLTDKFLRIISVGELSKKNKKHLVSNHIQKMWSSLFRHNDERTVEKNDKLWLIPFRDIQGLTIEDHILFLSTPSETWQLYISFKNELEDLHSILEIARTGNLKRIIDLGEIQSRANKNNADEIIFKTNSGNDILKLIEQLAIQKEKGYISEEQLEKKTNELLARL